MKAETRCQLCHRPLVVEIVPNEFFKTAALIEMATCADCLADLDKPTPPKSCPHPPAPEGDTVPPGWLPYVD